MTVGEKIKILRLRANLSQSQLADALCVSRAAVAKWENDNGLPDISNLKMLASFLGIDIDTLLDESKSLTDQIAEIPTLEEPIEMPESFCGKVCSQCAYREALQCRGCREGEGRRYGACRVADCCRNHIYSSCSQCAEKSSCNKYRNIPGQQQSKMKTRLDVKHKYQKCAPLMGKWVWVLFWMIIVQTVADLFSQEFVANWLPLVSKIGKIIVICCSLAYGIVLLKLRTITEGYRTAGICAVIMVLIDIMKLLFFSDNGLGIVLSLVTIVLALVSRYHEYMAHAYATEGIADDISSNWKAVWKLYIAMQAAMVLSIIFSSFGILLLLLVLLAICGLGIYQLVLLYRTAELFE